MSDNASLYGLNNKNCNRSGEHLWGKNEFNSTFPVALVAYMMDKEKNPVYISIDCCKCVGSNLKIVACDEVKTMHDVLGSPDKVSIFYSFETSYSPFATLLTSQSKLDHIDLVIKQGDTFVRPLEIKLTVVPDNTTAHKDKSMWGPELVIRPDATSYAAMSIYTNNSGLKKQALEILSPVTEWLLKNLTPNGVCTKSLDIIEALEKYLTLAKGNQQPFILQPIWMTMGQETRLNDEHAFDMFVWSDMALCALFINIAKDNIAKIKDSGKPTRHLRAALRLLLALHSLYLSEQVDIDGIYKSTALDLQTDKEFSCAGTVFKKIVSHQRLSEPVFPASILSELILNGGEKCLKPERRFDATIYFTASDFFDESVDS